jgi:ribosome-associated protein
MRRIKDEHKTKDSLEIARLCARAALAKKAEDVIILDVRQVSSFADYFVIMSGRSSRHVQGLAEAVEAAMRTKRIHGGSTEGLQEGLWVLLDFGDVIVNIFYKESRKFYDLEGLWHDAPRIEMNA